MLDDEKPTTAGELKLSDLPPIEDLKITIHKDKLVKVGRIVSIVDILVVVESIKSMPPLDLDTILFREDGQPVGQVFDVFGSILDPHYAIRFGNCDQIKSKMLNIGTEVYFSPQTDRSITKFAFVNELQKNKGTDASWENDNEPPDSLVEDSDDDDQLRCAGASTRQHVAPKNRYVF